MYRIVFVTMALLLTGSLMTGCVEVYHPQGGYHSDHRDGGQEREREHNREHNRDRDHHRD